MKMATATLLICACVPRIEWESDDASTDVLVEASVRADASPDVLRLEAIQPDSPPDAAPDAMADVPVVQDAAQDAPRSTDVTAAVDAPAGCAAGSATCGDSGTCSVTGSTMTNCGPCHVTCLHFTVCVAPEGDRRFACCEPNPGFCNAPSQIRINVTDGVRYCCSDTGSP